MPVTIIPLFTDISSFTFKDLKHIVDISNSKINDHYNVIALDTEFDGID